MVNLDTTAMTNVHHQRGNTVDPRLDTPNGLILPLGPNVTEGFKYRKAANINKNNDIVHNIGFFRIKFSIMISLLKFK
jgi:hypothetical protein